MPKDISIISSKVSERGASDFLQSVLGNLSIVTQNAIFGALNELSEGVYQGGLWSFYQLSNGGFYMAPDLNEPNIHLVCSGNGFESKMSLDAAGIVATLFGLGRVLWNYESEPLISHYYHLRDFAWNHPEASLIFACID